MTISKPECFSPGVNFCFYVNPEVPKKATVSQITSWFVVFESIFMLKKMIPAFLELSLPTLSLCASRPQLADFSVKRA